MNKRNWWIVGVVLVAILIIFLLVKMSVEKQDDSITIGGVVALSGDASIYGMMIFEGAELAIEEINNKGNLSMKIIWEDTESDDVMAVTAANKLINIDGVNIIIGSDKSSSTLAIAPIAESSKVILFNTISGSEDISNAGDYVFRNREGAVTNGKIMADFLMKEKNVQKVAVIVAQSSNSLSYGKSFTQEFESLGGDITISIEYLPDSTDFKTEIIKIKDSDVEAVYLATSVGIDGAIIVKQLRELGFDGFITGANALESEDFLQAVGKSGEGILFTSPMFDIENPTIKDYRERYNVKYGKDSNVYAANSYDAIMILSDAILFCKGDDDTNCIRDYIYGLKDYSGIAGLTSFDEDGEVLKPVMIKTIKDGQFVLYE